MANVGQNILVVSIAVIGSILLQAGLNHIWPWEKRGGMDGSWGCRAEGLEANAVVDMHHLAKGLPEPQRTQLQTLAGSYADTVITRDWPQMARGEVPEETEAIKSEMWDTVISVRAASATEVTAQQRALSQLSSLDQHRLTRIRQATTNLPSSHASASPYSSDMDYAQSPKYRLEHFWRGQSRSSGDSPRLNGLQTLGRVVG